MQRSADEDIDSKFATNVVVYHDGKMSWVPLGIYISTCPMDIRWFPFDEQLCIMKFGSWTYDGSKINLTKKWDYVDKETYSPNGEWDVMGELCYWTSLLWMPIYVMFKISLSHYYY